MYHLSIWCTCTKKWKFDNAGYIKYNIDGKYLSRVSNKIFEH